MNITQPPKHAITIVDDLDENLEHYKDLLSDEFDLNLFQKPLRAIDFLTTNKADLIILDIHMPEINGFEVFKKIKKYQMNIPIIFLTGDTSEETTIKGLDLGAQDIIVKPISIGELVARIKNKIELSQTKSNVIKIDNFTLYSELQQARLDGNTITLTPIEFKLIHLLVRSPNKIFSREDISERLWPGANIQNQNLDTHLSNLRKKLKPFSQNIKTIKSRGYLLRI